MILKTKFLSKRDEVKIMSCHLRHFLKGTLSLWKQIMKSFSCSKFLQTFWVLYKGEKFELLCFHGKVSLLFATCIKYLTHLYDENVAFL